MRACLSALSIALLLGPGCAVRSAVQIGRAERALTDASAHGVDPATRYDHVLATRYLDKAREEAARAQHRVAVEYARFALDHATRVTPPAPDAPAMSSEAVAPTETPSAPEPLWEGLESPATSTP